MKRIATITNSAFQEVSFIMENSEKVTFTLRFLPTQLSWMLDVDSETFHAHGISVCCSANILDKFHNIIDYGISVATIDGLDPCGIDDFSSGYCYFSILNKEEKDFVTEFLNGSE